MSAINTVNQNLASAALQIDRAIANLSDLQQQKSEDERLLAMCYAQIKHGPNEELAFKVKKRLENI